MVVPSRGRPRRLRWLLNELEDQTLDPGRFEVLVAHPAGDPAGHIVAEHRLGREGRARALALDAGAGRAAARNVGWRAARAPLVAFLHDDCRPPAAWLEDLLVLAESSPGSVIEGAVEVDPQEGAYLVARFKRLRRADPPERFAAACNVAYPRELLERLGGFSEDAELDRLDGADLAARARRAGGAGLAAPELVAFHSVRPVGPVTWLANLLAPAGLPAAVRRAPALRNSLVLGIALRPTHLLVPAAAAGVMAARRRPAALVAVLPWLGLLAHEQRRRGSGWGATAARLPVRAGRDLLEVGALAVGSVRARTPCL